jgi:hypothetical protein
MAKADSEALLDSRNSGPGAISHPNQLLDTDAFGSSLSGATAVLGGPGDLISDQSVVSDARLRPRPKGANPGLTGPLPEKDLALMTLELDQKNRNTT